MACVTDRNINGKVFHCFTVHFYSLFVLVPTNALFLIQH
jgi:hypothetical protein